MKKSCGFIGLIMVLILISSVAVQAALTGNLRGIIKDVEGNTIKGVKVTVTSPNLQGTRVAYSYEDGEYFIFDIPPGVYMLRAELTGLQTKEFTEIVVKVNQTFKFDFVMEVETQKGAMTVTAEAPVIDTTSATVSTVVEREFTERLPGADGYQAALSIPAGAVRGGDGNPNVGGQTKMDNTFLFDGVDTTDPLTNTFGSNLTADVVQQIEVQTGALKAEYGRTMGGLINVITKSGGNDFSGSFRLRLVNDNWVRDTRHDDDPGFRGQEFQDYNATFGGPIIKDRVWFFSAFSATPSSTDKDLNTNAYDSEGNIINESVTADENFYEFFAKVTVKANEKHNMVFQVFGDPAKIHMDEGVNYSAEAQQLQEQGGTNFNIHWKYLHSQNLIFDTKVSGALGHLDIGPESENESATAYYNSSKDVWYGNYYRISETNRNRYGVDFTTTYHKPDYHGDHKFKFGGGYQQLQLEEYNNYTGGGQYFETEEDESGNEIPYRRYNILNAEAAEDTEHIYALFIQDDWEIQQGLTLNLGLRYEYVSFKNDVDEEVASFDTMFAPRLGVTYDVNKDGKSKIYGAYGRYYSTLDTQIPSMLNEKSPTYQTWEYDPTNPDAGADGYYLYSQTGAEDFPNTMDPDLKPEYTDEFVLGYEREIMTNTAIGLRGIYRRTRDIVEDIGLFYDADGNPIDDPYGDDLEYIAYRVTNPEDARRNYWAIQLTTRRKTENLTMEASYTYSEAKGNVIGDQPQSVGTVSRFSVDFDLPGVTANNYGRLDWDAPHYFKLYAAYKLPWYDFWVSPSFFARSGYAYTKYGQDPIYGKGNTYPEGRGTYRYPGIAILDLSIHKDFDFNQFGMLTLYTQINNLFNTQKVVSVGQNEGNFFGITRDRSNPTTWYFGLKYAF